MNQTTDALLKAVRACKLCADVLTDGVRPVVQVHPQARVLIAGQAPGAKVHASGIPFDDASGDRLRSWMGITRETFYDQRQIAILPMGFCYPGKGKSGDLPPQPVCAPTWRAPLLEAMPNIELTLVIGQYAQKWHLPKPAKTLTETVKQWASYDNGLFPLPHPSPRNNIWMAKNTWFEKNVIPELRSRVSHLLKS